MTGQSKSPCGSCRYANRCKSRWGKKCKMEGGRKIPQIKGFVAALYMSQDIVASVFWKNGYTDHYTKEDLK